VAYTEYKSLNSIFILGDILLPKPKELFLIGSDIPEVPLPLKNQNKEFKKADPNAMESLDNYLKIAVQIYKYNMTKIPATFTRLVDYFEGLIERNEISSSLDVLGDRGIITSGYGEVEKERAGRIYWIDSDNVHRVRQIYEELVRSHEKPEDQIDYVDGLLMEK